MFGVYGINGPVYLGPLERMDHVRPLTQAAAVHAIAPSPEEAPIDATHRRTNDEAIRAYHNMRQHDLDRGPLYIASQVMQAPVITVQAENAVAQAWRVLSQNHIHQAPVLDTAQNLIGIVSERDLLTAIDIDGERIIETLSRQVHQVMTTPVVAATPATDIRRIAAAMLTQGVDGMPIVNDSGQLIGFISRGDILRSVITDPPLSLWR